MQLKLDVGKLNDERVAEEFANRPSGDFGGLGVSGNPEELWGAFKTTILDAAGGCLGTHRRVKTNFVSQRTLDTIDQSRRARLKSRAELSCGGIVFRVPYMSWFCGMKGFTVAGV